MSIAARRSHRGDEYQLAVAVHWLTRLLSDHSIMSVQVDAVSLPASPETVDVDDIVVTYSSGTTRHVQAKKNQPNHSRWQISDSTLKEELVKAHRQLQKTPGAIVEFCSHTPFGDLAALAESTRDYASHEVFHAQASARLRTVLDFSFAAAEYQALVGKSFQVLLVEDEPKQLPFLALKDAEGLRASAIYVRSGTTSTEAGHTELQAVLNRRIESGHSSQPSLDLDKHLAQLRSLDEHREDNDSWMNELLREQASRFEDTESRDYKHFIEDAYELKKQMILRLLGL